MVYVLNKDGQPLMPTRRHGKVRHLLEDGRAKVVQRTPFTIQLTYESGGYVQPVTLGVDAGSKTVGLSATTETEELYSSETELRGDIVDLLSTRRQYRRARRGRKTRYRKARFANRTKTKKQGWVAPSIQHKIEAHLKLVAAVCKILPVSKIIVEVASFDIQKIKNPEIEGEQYQQGEQLGSWNAREYVLCRDGHVCQHCMGASKDKVLETHHIESRKVGGDAPNNLVTVCRTCHDAQIAGVIQFEFVRGQKFAHEAFMGIMRWAFYDRLKALYPNVEATYGYLTKHARIGLGLEKTHKNDAYCISGNTSAERTTEWFSQRFVRRNNRQLHKATIGKGGIRKSNKAPYTVHGFRLFDRVRYDGKECFVFGRRASGYFDLRKLDGTKIHASAQSKKLRILEKSKTMLTERKGGAFLPPP